MIRNGHLCMSVRNSTGTYYPLPGATGANIFGATTVQASSRMADSTDRRARIYEVNVGDASADQVVIEDHSGQFICKMRFNAAAHNFLFGPLGIQISNGFRVNATATTGDFRVLWELD